MAAVAACHNRGELMRLGEDLGEMAVGVQANADILNVKQQDRPLVISSVASQIVASPRGAEAGVREALLRAAVAGWLCKASRGTDGRGGPICRLEAQRRWPVS